MMIIVNNRKFAHKNLNFFREIPIVAAPAAISG
jgi:hypothetical protein